jgi:hypothetical protein
VLHVKEGRKEHVGDIGCGLHHCQVMRNTNATPARPCCTLQRNKSEDSGKKEERNQSFKPPSA